jgi:catechol 2,3-dioxygenase-like lactoylglutathione lyase family enzyme
MSSRVNHVSVSAADMTASMEFYGRLLGAEPIPTPDFGPPVQWLSMGDTQLHLFGSDVQPTSQHHFGIEVDLETLVAAYRLARELGIFDEAMLHHHFIQLPADVVQLYLRDPSGNLVELNAVGASELPADVRAGLHVLADERPQLGTHADARLYIGADRPAA